MGLRKQGNWSNQGSSFQTARRARAHKFKMIHKGASLVTHLWKPQIFFFIG